MTSRCIYVREHTARVFLPQPKKLDLEQGWATIFVHGPHCSFISVSRATFQSKKSNSMLKKLAFSGRMWPAGRMLPPPDLEITGSSFQECYTSHSFCTIQTTSPFLPDLLGNTKVISRCPNRQWSSLLDLMLNDIFVFYFIPIHFFIDTFLQNIPSNLNKHL
jgi:hypothetical protein